MRKRKPKQSSLLQELIKGLPPDPTRAIVLFADRVLSRVIEPREMVGTSSDHRALATFTRQFCEKFELPVSFDDMSLAANEYESMKRHIEKIAKLRKQINDIEMGERIDDLIVDYERKSSAISFRIARLNADEKQKILHGLERVRKIIESSAIPTRKKNALFDRLTDLVREVNTDGTRTDRFFAFASEAAFVVGDMTTKAKPFFDEIKDVLKIVGRARARQEGISLPPGDEVLTLPAPQQRSSDLKS